MHLSLVVAAFDMARELPRTLATLGPGYQRGAGALSYDVTVVDNGSPVPVEAAALRSLVPDLAVVRVADAAPSPAAAINRAVAATRGDVVGVFVDGARMASPGMLALAAAALAGDRRGIVGTLAFHLGPDVQSRSVLAGYGREAEDALLASVPWQTDGDRLFDIAVLAASSRAGWFGTIAESNAVFMDRALWERLGGLDSRFAAPGGGYVNLDFWSRAVALAPPTMLLGEATFHQIHGGAATGGDDAARAAMAAEYAALRGVRYRVPDYLPRHVGEVDAARLARGLPRPAV